MLYSLLPQLATLILFFMAGWLFYHFTARPTTPPQPASEPDLQELEKNLNQLLEQNRLNEKTENLQQQLQSSKSHIIANYLQRNKKDLQGYHLFQLILSLIKNQAEDTKIIKVMHRYFPSCATAHLYAMLNAYKKFLSISRQDGCQKELLRDLNQNHLRSTLVYLEKKLNQIINQVPLTAPALQQPLINQAMIYGLIFASFSQFDNPYATEKILRLVSVLTPELFQYWHRLPPKKTFKKKTNTCMSVSSPIKHFASSDTNK